MWSVPDRSIQTTCSRNNVFLCHFPKHFKIHNCFRLCYVNFSWLISPQTTLYTFFICVMSVRLSVVKYGTAYPDDNFTPVNLGKPGKNRRPKQSSPTIYCSQEYYFRWRFVQTALSSMCRPHKRARHVNMRWMRFYLTIRNELQQQVCSSLVKTSIYTGCCELCTWWWTKTFNRNARLSCNWDNRWTCGKNDDICMTRVTYGDLLGRDKDTVVAEQNHENSSGWVNV